MKKDIIGIIFVFIILGIVVAIGSNLSLIKSALFPEAESEKENAVSISYDDSDAGTKHLRDNNTLYEDDDGVVTMYLTVREGNKSEGTNHTWEEINNYSVYYYDEKNIDRYKVEALLQVGDENGVSKDDFGYGDTAPNATVQIRGQSSSLNAQKNYKIELKKNKGSWNGQTTIALNKHMTDGLRFRNKLGFDLLTDIDQLMSLRTQFVHLYVNDLTDGEDSGFEDYGLYTQVEQLNKKALRTHGLDRAGHLYKINYFEFQRYEDVIKLATDSTYDKKAFEEYLEIKGNEDHSKLIAMLEDVNDYGLPIETVIEKHFDMENLTYWLAFNILTGNYDTQSRNAYLYSPLNKDTWYFYCWDLDASFRKGENDLLSWSEAGSWDQGVSNYWGNVLFQRCLKSKEFRQQLDAAVQDIRSHMTRERIKELSDDYSKIILPYLYSDPDVGFAPLTEDMYNEVVASLPDLVDVYYQQYLDSLDKPMPFFIGTPQMVGVKINYTWDASYDFDQEDIVYKVVVARNLECTDIVTSYEGNWTSFSEPYLEPGQYFIKASARNQSGKVQDAFDTIETENGKEYGIMCFYVNLDGTVTRSEYLKD
ncbi:CotH kinase family protein [Butyrivibrio sp. VCB2006]|uniref:CotH kinase family protein n=1 Tax=Butyrivibrio sp. VCB2006 TaxID=1280679 RepID=UPI000423550F|nr:CotH kinase family protein [Butyrivibrio sp. VCB2006]